MLKFCTDYLRLILFCSGLLVGIQVPAVVDQYAKRIDAHLTEALDIFAGFQHTADRYFDGSIERLITHYEKSDDPVFKDDAINIRYISERVSLLKSEKTALAQSSFMRFAHVVFYSDSKVINETMGQYSYIILINPEALIWGVCIAFIIALLIDSVLGTVYYVLFGRKRKLHNLDLG